MKGDFERVTFDPVDGFASVLLQQGRLLLPADFNEQGAIHQHFLRTLICDLVGKRWRAGKGFFIGIDPKESTLGKALLILEGHYYIYGLLCANPSEVAYARQPFAPTPESIDDVTDPQFGIYLDCWERHVTWMDYPRIREQALGGADTATRAQIVWQVRPLTNGLVTEKLNELVAALKNRKKANLPGDDATEVDRRIKETQNVLKNFDSSGPDCTTVDAVLEALDNAPPRLAADAKATDENADPCAIAPDAEYRGRENQLYRVEIHRPGLAGHATYKWSRENGSVTCRVLDVEADTDSKVIWLTVESLGRDRRTNLCQGDWVELLDRDAELGHAAAALLQVLEIQVQQRRVKLNGVAGNIDPKGSAILRRWDHKADKQVDGALLVAEHKTEWTELERGVKIRFAPGGTYRTGDYWLIPARVLSGDIDWPLDDAGEPRFVEPHGIRHYRAPLAVVKKSGANWTVDNAATQCGKAIPEEGIVG